MHSLLNKIAPLIDAHKIISFDIFDTLLLRPYMEPRDLLLHLEKINNLQGFQKARLLAEHQAFEKKNGVSGVSFDEIYEVIPDNFKQLKSSEKEFEKTLIRPNLEMKEVYDYAVSQNKEIILISDMYFDSIFLNEILSGFGFNAHTKLYVSCECQATKHDGKLFSHVLNDKKANPHDILHIGDNAHSDQKMAQKYAFHTFLYTPIHQQFLKSNKRFNTFYQNQKNDLGASILLGTLALYFSQKTTVSSYWQDFGFTYAGGVIYGYMQWLDQVLAQKSINEVMFVARDGYILQKVFNLIKTRPIPTHYYYAPRILNQVCNLNYESAISLSEKNGLYALNSILDYFKTKAPQQLQNAPKITSCDQGRAFIKQHQALFDQLAQNEILNWREYLSQFDVKNQHIALIDSYSDLLSAQKSLITGLPDKKITGFYFMTGSKTQKDIQKYDTVSFHGSQDETFVDWDIMEFYMSAPTPPAQEIRAKEVIFKSVSDYEKTRLDLYPTLAKGIEDFAFFTIKLFNKTPLFFTADMLTDWTNVLCLIPTKKDKEMFLNIQHANDANHVNYVPIPKPWFKKMKNVYIKGEKILNQKSFKILNINLFQLQQTKSRQIISVFNLIPLFQKKQKDNRSSCYLFNIPFYKVKTKNNKSKIYLFHFLPILTIKRKYL